MKTLKKIKLGEVTNDQALDIEQMAKITGSINLLGDGCQNKICDNNRDAGTAYCTDSVCTSGIGVCNQKT